MRDRESERVSERDRERDENTFNEGTYLRTGKSVQVECHGRFCAVYRLALRIPEN